MPISLEEINYAEKYAQLAKKYLNPKELEEMYGFSRSWQSKARMLSSKLNIPYIKVGVCISENLDTQIGNTWTL